MLEKTLKVSKEVPAVLAPWRQRLEANDVAGVILRRGSSGFRQGAESDQQYETVRGAGRQSGKKAAEDVRHLRFDLSGRGKGSFGLRDRPATRQAKYSGITSRTSLVSGGQWARLITQKFAAGENLLKGLPDEPFVAAGGGAVSEAMFDELMKFSFNMMKSMPDLYGLSEEQVNKMSEMSMQSLKGIRVHRSCWV